MIGSVISMMITLIVVSIVAITKIEDIYRYVQLSRLCDEDIKTREYALNYVVNHARDDEKVLEGAKAALAVEDEECFKQIVGALALGGVWGPEFGEHWLRYQVIRAGSSNVEVRQLAMSELARMAWKGELEIDTARFEPVIKARLKDENVNVRYNALIAGAMFEEGEVRLPLLKMALADENAVIREHAWMLIGLTEKQWTEGLDGFVEGVDLEAVDAVGMMWAMKRLNAKGFEAFVKAHLNEGEEKGAHYGELLYLSDEVGGSELNGMRKKWLGMMADQKKDEVVRGLAWNVIASSRPGANSPLQTPVLRIINSGTSDDVLAASAIAQGWWKFAPTITKNLEESPEKLFTGEAGVRLRELALFETLPGEKVGLSVRAEMPYLIRLHAVRVSTTAGVEDLLPVFKAEQPSVRDLALVVALDRFGDEELKALAKALIVSFDDHQRAAGAILGGMLPKDEQLMALMRKRHERVEDWALRQHYAIGLNAHGERLKGPGLEELLNRTDVARTTTILAMLDQGNLTGLDWLLSPIGDSPVNLRFLFDQLRYYAVLKHYVPELPGFDVYASEAVQRMQVKVIRDWYLVNRKKLKFDGERKKFGLE